MSPQSYSWDVETQQPTIDLDATGHAVQGMRVFFVTSHGVHASVFIPQARYNADTVKAAIEDAVKTIDAVHKLKG